MRWICAASLAAMLGCSNDGHLPLPIFEVCDAILCQPDAGSIPLSEGGELRLQVMESLDAETGAVDRQADAWLLMFRDQLPFLRTYLGPELPDAPGCFDLTGGTHVFSGNTALNGSTIRTRSYIDVGPSARLQHPGGPITLTRHQEAQDPDSHQPHPTIYLSEPEDAELIEGGHAYVPEPIGDGGLGLMNGVDMFQGTPMIAPPTAYLPPAFTMRTPAEEAFFSGLAIDRNADLVLAWERAGEVPADWPAAAQITSFLSPDQAVLFLCLHPSSADTDEMRIPAALFNDPAFPEQGLLVHGSLIHVMWTRLGPHRFDFMGASLKRTWFELVDQP